MADCRILVPIILAWEGGWSDKIDFPTMHGVILDTFKTYRKIKGLPIPTVNDLKNISGGEWFDLYKTMFWDKWEADLIHNQSIANILVDWEFNSGNWGIKVPQEIMHLNSDGVVGNRTITELNSEVPSVLFQELQEGRINFLKNIVIHHPNKKTELKGWLNRANYFKFSN